MRTGMFQMSERVLSFFISIACKLGCNNAMIATLRSILILSSHPELGVWGGIFPSNLASWFDIYIYLFSHACYTFISDHPVNNSWGVNIMKLRLMQFSPASSDLFHFRHKVIQGIRYWRTNGSIMKQYISDS
jgi:hypothetical protein